MKKILIAILIVLLGLMAYYSLTQEINIFSIKISGIEGLKTSNEKLTKEIEATNKIINTEYQQKIASLNTELKNLSKARQKYVDIVNLSSPEEILAANQEETYSIEFLWAKIGNHATNEKVDLKFEVVSSSLGNNIYDLNFTVSGEYVQIMNFIYAIEDDVELYYRIKTFKIIPSGSNLTATFTVKNVTVDSESFLVQASSTQSGTASQNEGVIQRESGSNTTSGNNVNKTNTTNTTTNRTNTTNKTNTTTNKNNTTSSSSSASKNNTAD